jgi:hypothetical protein
MLRKLSIPGKIYLPDILYFAVALSLYEVFIGGGGRFLQLGPLTFRMYIFFALCIFGILGIVLKRKADTVIILILFIFLSSVSFSAILGYINNADPGYIFEDVKPLFYFLSVIYISATINYSNIHKVIRIIKVSGLILASAYLIILLLITTGKIDFLRFYDLASASGEVMFRGSEGLFFYKGFLYLNIAFFFFYLGRGRKSFFFAVLTGLAVVLTLTRGFIFSLAICLFIYYIFINRNPARQILFLVTALIAVTLFVVWISPFIGNRSLSDSTRITQIAQVFGSANLFSVLFGHGFGIGVPVRPVHMEISYLEIFHKQGIIGLSFWIVILCLIVYYYSGIRTMDSRFQPDAFLLGTIFIYIQTLTNPFLNNPIGMSFILLTLVIFKKLFEYGKNDISLHPYI